MVYEVKPHDEEPQVGKEQVMKIFLAGTIDMGNSVDWQRGFVNWLKNNFTEGTYIVYNPRRDKGLNDDSQEFDYQVNWELDHLEESDMIIMNILGTSKSPISLLEMGLFARSGKLTVCCEPNFYRYGNVKITCKKYGVELFDSLAECFNTNDII